ncbi:MAG TPA: FHA domain-containing protein [Ktedonobacterales bacterium]|jgi:pSer/pThr/pTyr-binding forkhead associated (FHA) protein
MEYLNFDLEVGPGHAGSYPIAVRSPAGEAQITMRFPFDGPALESRLKDLRIALLRSGGVPRRSLSPEMSAVQDFGQRLFDALITEEVRSRYDVSRQHAEHQQFARKQETGLRLRLHLQSPELAVVPWEYLYDARQGEYVCLSRHTPLVRYLNLPQVLQPLKVEPPLRILGMIASPSDLEPLNIQHEKDRMREALKDLEAVKLVELKWLRGQTWQDLQKAMWGGPWHIFHFIGHGGFNPDTNEGVLALADEHGKTHLLNATELGRLLADHTSLRLALLNACEGAKGSELDLFSSTAATLARRGVPAVLAMQYDITDHAAIQCGRTFYSALAAAMPVDGAVAEARKAISMQVTNSLEWGTPVLYLRTQSSTLFDLPPQRADPPTLTIGSPIIHPPLPPAYLPMLLVLSIAQSAPPLRAQVRAEGTTIGREEGNDLVVPDDTVSKRHLRLAWHESAWQVIRLPQTGPLYVNGRQQDQTNLHPGDQLVIGGMVLRFERADAQWRVTNLGSEQAPLLLTPEPVPHLTVDWPGGRFVAPLREGSITVGRMPDRGLVVPVLPVSKEHALLYRASDGSYIIQDMGSTNGLTLQGTRIQQHRLQHGDRLVIGSQDQGQFVILAYATPRR